MTSLLAGTAAPQFEGSSSTRRGPAIPSTPLLPVIPAGSSSGVFSLTTGAAMTFTPEFIPPPTIKAHAKRLAKLGVHLNPDGGPVL